MIEKLNTLLAKSLPIGSEQEKNMSIPKLIRLLLNTPKNYNVYNEDTYEAMKIIVTSGYTMDRKMQFFISNLIRLKYKDKEDIESTVHEMISDNLVLLFLCQYIQFSIALEKILKRVRKHILVNEIITLEESKFVPLCCALSCQQYLINYTWITDIEEEEKINDLETSLATNGNSPLTILKYGMYRSIHTLPKISDIKSTLIQKTNNLEAVIELLISEPLEVENEKSKLKSFSKIEDVTSIAVKEQYEESPYPHWNKIPPHRESLAYKLKNFSFDWMLKDQLDNLNILVAGCGTGKHSAHTVLSNPGSKVTAIDISRSSLAYAQVMTNKHGIDNLTFLHGDILDLANLNTKFHYIESAGVIHHMQDQDKAWRVLVDQLEPGGILKLGVYLKIARFDIILQHNIIKKNNIGSDVESIKRYREKLITDPDNKLMLKYSRTEEFYSLNMVRDLLFHVHEYQYTISEIEEYVDRLNLNFIGFEMFPYLREKYKSLFPDDPGLTSMSNWKKFEKYYAGSICQLFFYVQKKP